MKRVAGYARVSTQAQATDGTSLEAQKKKIEDRCSKEEYELVRIYADGGISGSSRNRPQLQELLKDAKAGKFDTVLFTKLDRLGRNNRDIHNIYYELKEECGIDLFCIDDHSLNTDGSMGKMMLAISAGFAELERSNIKERTFGGRKIKWRAQKAIIGAIPYGYKRGNIPGSIEINEEQAKVYKRIVDYYLGQRFSTKKLALQLTAEGVPVPSASKGEGKQSKSKHWWSTTILDMLRNPAYKGEVEYNQKVHVMKNGGRNGSYYTTTKEDKPREQWVTVKLPRLISDERWQQVQDRIENQKRKPKRTYKGYEDHFLLDGLAYCGVCGGKMRKHINFDKNGNEHSFVYKCYWRDCAKDELKMSVRDRCSLEPFDANLVDSQIYSQIAEMLTRPRKYAETWLKDLNKAELEEKVIQLEHREKELQRQLKEGFMYIRGTTDTVAKEIYLKEQRELQQTWEDVRRELDKAHRDYDLVVNKVKRFEQFDKSLNERGIGSHFKTQALLKGYLEGLPFADKKRIVEAVISPETGGRVQVSYVTPADFLDGEELKGMSQEDQNKPLKDRQPCVVGDFCIDLDKIENVINGLDRNVLLEQVSAR